MHRRSDIARKSMSKIIKNEFQTVVLLGAWFALQIGNVDWTFFHTRVKFFRISDHLVLQVSLRLMLDTKVCLHVSCCDSRQYNQRCIEILMTRFACQHEEGDVGF